MRTRHPIKTGPKRILIATIGSLGDLHPCLALGLELKRRGHRVTIAATEYYRAKIENAGLHFRPLRPNWDPADSATIRRCENLRTGPEVLYREIVLPHLRDTYSDLYSAAQDADLMMVGELVLAAPLIAEKLAVPWVSLILSPCSFFSAHDPSVLVNAPWLIHLRKLGWRSYQTVLNLGHLAIRPWWAPVRQLRRELGLRVECNPVFHDKFSPDLVLALFSSRLALPQPDWPPQTSQPGFIVFDREQSRQTSQSASQPELSAFLSDGEAPIVFTLGSTAVHNPGNFFLASIEAAKILGRRALLIGADPSLSASSAPGPSLLSLRYAPYSLVFPHAAVVVHQGGSGTTGQVMQAGKPMLIVPYGWDQPDNGARVQRLGIGLTLARTAYTAKTAAAALRLLLGQPAFKSRSETVAGLLRKEDALTAACDAIESVS